MRSRGGDDLSQFSSLGVYCSGQILVFEVSKRPYQSARHYQVIIGPLSGHYWVIIGSLLGHYWVIIESLLGHYWIITRSL